MRGLGTVSSVRKKTPFLFYDCPIMKKWSKFELE